jgi:hypothetical protein
MRRLERFRSSPRARDDEAERLFLTQIPAEMLVAMLQHRLGRLSCDDAMSIFDALVHSLGSVGLREIGLETLTKLRSKALISISSDPEKLQSRLAKLNDAIASLAQEKAAEPHHVSAQISTQSPGRLRRWSRLLIAAERSWLATLARLRWHSPEYSSEQAFEYLTALCTEDTVTLEEFRGAVDQVFAALRMHRVTLSRRHAEKLYACLSQIRSGSEKIILLMNAFAVQESEQPTGSEPTRPAFEEDGHAELDGSEHTSPSRKGEEPEHR